MQRYLPVEVLRPVSDECVQRQDISPVAPLQAYALVSVGNLVASTCQYDSLKYVSFALQTLAKCCKMLPVMLWGAVIGGQRYSIPEYVSAAAVLAGCTSFVFSGSVLSVAAPGGSESKQLYALGGLLLLLYLAFDGFASTWQEQLFTGARLLLSMVALPLNCRLFRVSDTSRGGELKQLYHVLCAAGVDVAAVSGVGRV